MRDKRVWLLGVCVCLILASVVLFAAACGGSTTTTSAGAATTIDDKTTTTKAPTTTIDDKTTTTAAGAAVDAAALYAKDCKGCHAGGVSGSASSIEAIIKSGTGSMPGFTSSMSAAEITALAAYAAGGGK
jgi:mono/diheme cytochrome c family protein